MRKKLPILLLTIVFLLQAFIPAVYAASKNEVAASSASFCPFDTTSEGAGKTKPDQLHHFATNKSKTYTPKIKETTDKYGLDLDKGWNKEYLQHQGRHPNEYHDYILDQMKQFDNIAKGDKNKFLELYNQLKQEVINTPEMLTKNYWK